MSEELFLKIYVLQAEVCLPLPPPTSGSHMLKSQPSVPQNVAAFGDNGFARGGP